ncbi:serum paraoxonase/arylesterase 2-like [Branchiostoma floridae x Branchiostoma japonicum]
MVPVYMRWIVIVFLAWGVLQHLIKLWFTLGYHKAVLYNHQPGPCRVVPGVEHGAEDITTLPNGLAFISSGLWLPGSPHSRSEVRGRILTFNFSDPESGVKELNFSEEFDLENFNPHGLSVWTDPLSGRISVLVISHQRRKDQVEVFTFDVATETLEHQETIRDELIYSGNDLLALGPDSFYLTNDVSHGARGSSLARKLETYLLLPFGNVVFYNGTQARPVAEGLVFPNGVNMSPDRRYLYVGAGFTEELRIFRRFANNSLVQIESLPLHSFVDNIEVDPQTGDLYIGLHPVIGKTPMIHYDPWDPPGAQVLRIKNAVTGPDITELFVNNGTKLQGSSVASFHKGALLIGSVFDRLLYCEVRTL